jgi:hypothetical protein
MRAHDHALLVAAGGVLLFGLSACGSSRDPVTVSECASDAAVGGRVTSPDGSPRVDAGRADGAADEASAAVGDAGVADALFSDAPDADPMAPCEVSRDVFAYEGEQNGYPPSPPYRFAVVQTNLGFNWVVTQPPNMEIMLDDHAGGGGAVQFNIVDPSMLVPGTYPIDSSFSFPGLELVLFGDEACLLTSGTLTIVDFAHEQSDGGAFTLSSLALYFDVQCDGEVRGCMRYSP